MGERLRRAAMRTLAALQRRRWYRRLARRLVGRTQVREATAAEALAVRERWPLEEHAASGPHSDVTTYIAFAGKRIAGWHYLQRNDAETLWPGFVLTGLYVRRCYRGLGLARPLMQVPIDRAAREGAREVLFVANMANTPAITLYQSMGFVAAGDGPWTTWLERVRRQYGIEETVMRLPL